MQPDYFANIEEDGGGDFMLTFFFYVNILLYLSYCRFISSITFRMDDGSEEYSEYRDLCVGGAYYEL